ncbi:MAG: FAD-binding and (Fe-S)-binding domain-containing protein [Planctomycetota bacterium]|jgi:FAD/FMN-containing dehydrogenase/Fe-S oxidoreductase
MDDYSKVKYEVNYGQLRSRVKGAVKDDPISRALYASSASIVEVWPSCVVEPVNAEDVIATVKFARELHIPITCRGAGSGVVGQSLGQGIIIDFAVHMNEIIETQPRDGWVRVQPGVVKDALDLELGTFQMFWPPDPSSSPWCTVGAMIANNSGGAKSIRWGTSKDYLLELDVLLADGDLIKLRPLDVTETGQIVFPVDATAGEIRLAKAAYKLARENAEVIASERPESTRNSSGYNLFELLHPKLDDDYQQLCPRVPTGSNVGGGQAGVLDMPRLFSGSEGTLGVLLEAKIKVLKLPKVHSGLTLWFDSNEAMAEGVVKLLPTCPTKLEVMDRSIVDVAAKSDPAVLEGIPDNLVSILIVEYWSNSPEDNRARIKETIKLLVDDGPAFEGNPAYDAEELASAWKVRKVASPILSRVKGDHKPTRWIEDCAVPPWKLPEFIAGFKDICERNGFVAHLFGHGGEGNLHVNPFANPKLEDDRARMRKAADETFALLKSLKGTISGEHGDGLMRSPYLKTMFGAVYPLFVEIKELFDARYLLSPLNKIVKDEDRSITSFIRVGKGYERKVTGTALDNSDVLQEIEKCHGCGKCRNYCPLMRVGQEEKYSARAKANLLRGVISGRLDADLLVDKEFKDNLDLCIACEQCLVECPTQVDIPGISMVFREQYTERVGTGGVVADLLSKPDRMGKLATKMTGLTNSILKSRFLRGIAQLTTGLDERRKLPQFKKAGSLSKLKPLDVPEDLKADLPVEVVIYPGCFAEYYDPDGERNTLIAIIEALGIQAHTPELNCCGISKITQGDVKTAAKDALENLDKLRKPVARGAKILFSAPSCMLSVKREWPRIVGEQAQPIADACEDAHQFLHKIFSHPRMHEQLSPLAEKVAYHEPCHSKILGEGQSAKDLVDLLNEKSTVNLRAGCCGLSGTFGVKTDNFDMSMKIGMPLFHRINMERPDKVTTPCGVCQTQIHQGVDTGKDGVEVVHPLKLLHQALLK